MASIIRMPKLKAKIDLPKSSIYELIRLGEFPSPIVIGKRRVAWVVSEVDDWLACVTSAHMVPTSRFT